MKKTYEAPSVEKIAFQYRDQVVVASNGGYIVNCGTVYDSHDGNEGCELLGRHDDDVNA